MSTKPLTHMAKAKDIQEVKASASAAANVKDSADVGTKKVTKPAKTEAVDTVKATPKVSKVPKTPKTPKAPKGPTASGDESKPSSPSSVPMPIVKKVKEYLNSNEKTTHIGARSAAELKVVLEAFVHTIVEMTKNGTTVSLPNHMTFKRTFRNERTHRNPKTREEIVKPAHYVLSMDVKAFLKKEFAQIEVTTDTLSTSKAKIVKAPESV